MNGHDQKGLDASSPSYKEWLQTQDGEYEEWLDEFERWLDECEQDVQLTREYMEHE